jgi:hypothetical protein
MVALSGPPVGVFPADWSRVTVEPLLANIRAHKGVVDVAAFDTHTFIPTGSHSDSTPFDIPPATAIVLEAVPDEIEPIAMTVEVSRE